MENKSWLNATLLIIIILILSLGLYFILKGQMEDTINPGKARGGVEENTAVLALDLSDEMALIHKDILYEAIRKPANFDGHYVVASWGCGSSCQNFSIVDKLTGKVFIGPSDDYGNTSNYFGDPDFENNRYSVESNTIKVIGYDSILLFTFDGDKFTKTQSLPFPEELSLSLELPTPYVRAQTIWPPKIEESEDKYFCNIGTYGMGVETVVEEKSINGKVYCVSHINESTAGTIYKTFTYTFKISSGTRKTTFTLAYPNSDGCNSHGTVLENKCEEAQGNFNVDLVIDHLFNKN